MHLRLVSDFTDWYDHIFDSRGLELRRVTTDGPDKVEAFKLFRGLGIKTPKCGTTLHLKNSGLPLETRVVVYQDIKAHGGEGKKLMYLGDAYKAHPNLFSSQYILSDLQGTHLSEYAAKSSRILFIGGRCFKTEYYSRDDWRSNCGDTSCGPYVELTSCLPFRPKIDYPLFAIDFVGEYEPLAIDLNVAPGTYGTSLKEVISASEILLALKAWYVRQINEA